MNTPDLRPFVPESRTDALNEALRRTERFSKATGIESIRADKQIYDAHLERFGYVRDEAGSLRPGRATIDIETALQAARIDAEWDERFAGFYPEGSDPGTPNRAPFVEAA